MNEHAVYLMLKNFSADVWKDFAFFDHIVGMDASNVADLKDGPSGISG